jgi:hypothetical protein
MTYAETQADFIAFADEALAAGKRLIICNETPREDRTGTPRADHIAFSKWLPTLEQDYGHVFVADTMGASLGIGENTFILNDDLDWLHMRPSGYDHAADAVGAVFTQLFGADGRFLLSDEDETGVVNPNSALAGTGGTLTSGVTGSLANSLVAALQSMTGMSFVCSKETDSNGLVWQRVDFSGTPSDTSASKFMWLNADIDEANWPVGTEAEAGALVEWFDCYNVTCVSLELAGTGDSTMKSRALDGYNATENRPLPRSSRGAKLQLCPAIQRQADATPSASGLTVGLLIACSTQPRSITGAFRSGNYVTVTTTAAHGLLAGQRVTTTGLTADYCVTATDVAGVPLENTTTALVQTSDVVTATTPYPHRFLPGQLVTIAGTSYNATGVRVLTVPTPTTFTYTLAGNAGAAADAAGTVTPAGTAGTQLTYFAPGSASGEAADNTGTLSPPVSGTARFALPTVRLVA